MLIKKGMKVRVISGAHKGSEGKVLFTSPKKQRLSKESIAAIKETISIENKTNNSVSCITDRNINVL